MPRGFRAKSFSPQVWDTTNFNKCGISQRRWENVETRVCSTRVYSMHGEYIAIYGSKDEMLATVNMAALNLNLASLQGLDRGRE